MIDSRNRFVKELFVVEYTKSGKAVAVRLNTWDLRKNTNTPRNTWVRSTLPTGAIVYFEGLSRRLRSTSFAVRRRSCPEASCDSGPVKGSSEPLLRFLPVRFGTVTLSKTLFDGTLVE